MTPLIDYLATSYLPERPGLSVRYRRLLTATVRQLDSFAQAPLTISGVDRTLLADWARSMLTTHRPASINDKLRMVRTILLAAYDDGLLDRPPRRVRRLPENQQPPEAWTIEEVRRIVQAARAVPGTIAGLPASDWWESLTLAVYWTGCRISAMLGTTVDNYHAGRGLLVSRQKNGRAQWYPLPASCCEAIERIVPESGPIWPWPEHRSRVWVRFRRIVASTGVPCPTTGRSLFHRLRRTNASYCAAADPAIAQRQMDHSDWSLTRRSYVDPRIACQRSAADVLPDPCAI